MRKRPQFFEDLDRELRGEPEPENVEPEQPKTEVRVETVTRIFHQPAAYREQLRQVAQYCQNVAGIQNQTATGAMLDARRQYAQSPSLMTSMASSSVTLWPRR